MCKIKKFLNKYSLIIALAVLSPIIIAPFVYALDEQSVAATVTVTNVSLTVSDGTIAYGTLSTSTTKDTTTASLQLDDSQTVTNNGNVAIDVKVKATADANVSPWSIGASVDSEVYTHKTCVTTCDSSPSWTAMTTSYGSAILSNIVAEDTADVDFQIGTPSSTASFTEKSVNVYLMAIEHT
ncbi:MAG: hypothetical protein PHE21_02960 [Candidatus Dojkabacteria bacterium]|nr:hypothetical protein [Candidatus Dojkabacteria bacterium]